MMKAVIEIRAEEVGDVEAIREVTCRAFFGVEHSLQNEGLMIECLRRAGALSVSLVAVWEGVVVGHLAITPVRHDGGQAGWYGLGPVSVEPAMQRRGIGSAMIERALEDLRGMGASGCCLVGHLAYYQRFGFQVRDGLVYEGLPKEYFLAIGLKGPIQPGRLEYHPAFGIRDASEIDELADKWGGLA